MNERPPASGRTAVQRPAGAIDEARAPVPAHPASGAAATSTNADDDGHPPAADGFLLLDKPPGLSSFQALRPIKRIFRGRKVGHAGTLDPAASGLLLAGIGAGTRLLEHLEGMPKTYSFEARFGCTSDSYDMEGQVTPGDEEARARALDLGAPEVDAALRRFRGPITQVPPVYSAVKIDGKRACDRVRDGETVELESREVFVHALELTGFAAGPEPVGTFLLTCSKGTYVRSLVHDLGKALGCGAVTDKIRRLAIGPFRVADAAAPDAPEPRLLPLETAVQHLPAARLAAEAVAAFLNGQSASHASYSLDAPPAGDPAALTLRALDPAGRLLALAALDGSLRLCPKKVLVRA